MLSQVENFALEREERIAHVMIPLVSWLLVCSLALLPIYGCCSVLLLPVGMPVPGNVIDSLAVAQRHAAVANAAAVGHAAAVVMLLQL
jgi:hypothetical protein